VISPFYHVSHFTFSNPKATVDITGLVGVMRRHHPTRLQLTSSIRLYAVDFLMLLSLAVLAGAIGSAPTALLKVGPAVVYTDGSYEMLVGGKPYLSSVSQT